MPSPDTPTTRPPKRRIGFIIPLGLALALIVIGGDIIPLALRPMDFLGMPYPHVLSYTHIIVPILAFGVLLVFNRSQLLAIIVFLVTVIAINQVARWADEQPVKIPVKMMLDCSEWEALQKRLGFKVWEQSNTMYVDQTQGHAEQLIRELKRQGIWKP